MAHQSYLFGVTKQGRGVDKSCKVFLWDCFVFFLGAVSFMYNCERFSWNKME